MTQVHPENATQLLQSQHLLLLLPPGALRLAAVLRGGVAVQAGGRAYGLRHGLITQLPGSVLGMEETKFTYLHLDLSMLHLTHSYIFHSVTTS